MTSNSMNNRNRNNNDDNNNNNYWYSYYLLYHYYCYFYYYYHSFKCKMVHHTIRIVNGSQPEGDMLQLVVIEQITVLLTFINSPNVSRIRSHLYTHIDIIFTNMSYIVYVMLSNNEAISDKYWCVVLRVLS